MPHDSCPFPLPSLILIADQFTCDAVAERAIEAVVAGVRWVHLRDHGAAAEMFLDKAGRLSEALRKASPEVRITINRRLDAAVQLRMSFHTGKAGPGIKEARRVLPAEAVVGYSAHDEDEAALAAQNGADYLFFSPIFPTKSKPGHPGVGLSALQAVCESVSIPVYALGGVTPELTADCLNAGAHGVAVITGILQVPDIAQATGQFLRALKA